MKELDEVEDVAVESNEHDDELSRRIREEVIRMQQEQSERAEQSEEEGENEGESEDSESESEEEPDGAKVKSVNFLKLLFTGNILVRRGFAKYYGQMVVIAGLFLLSIVVMFWSLHLDMEHNTLSRDVQLLRERSVRLQEVRYSRSSHSSILEELERRGIDVGESTKPATVIKKSKLW